MQKTHDGGLLSERRWLAICYTLQVRADFILDSARLAVSQTDAKAKPAACQSSPGSADCTVKPK